MAILALHRCVGAKKGKPVLVILDLLDGNLPAANRVALGAIRAEFSAVDVRVTIGAIPAHVSENGLGVALRASHFFVHATQWIVGFVVVKFGDGPDGLPAGGGVAVFAGNIQGSVRTSGSLPLS